MGVPIEQWVETIKAHPAKYRFKGLQGDGDRHAGGWFTDVREAAVYDEQFMDRWMEDEYKSAIQTLVEALKGPPPQEGHEDDSVVEDYAQFIRRKFWSAWDEPENINKAPARKVIEKLEPKEAGSWCGKHGYDQLRWDWANEYCMADLAWETIREQDPDHILKDHPPTHMLDHASDEAVPLEDVYFVCPGCHQQPVTKAQVEHGHFYCGLCGASDALAEGEPFSKFLEALEIKTWPFKKVP